MPTKAGTAYVDVEARTDKLDRGIRGAAEGIRSHLGGAFAAVAGIAGATFAGVQVTRFLAGTIEDYRESARIGRLSNQVIASTGGVANVSAEAVGKLAESLAAKTGVDDELIQSGENVLLTFTNIRNEVGKGNDIFDQATTAAVDMSAALGTDLQGSVIQVGKALNDPIRGITALQRVGVSFTQAQRDQIQALVDSGQTLEAQKVILGELSKEFGGAAAAAADPMAQLQVIAGNFREELGGALFPLVQRIAPVLGQILPQIGDSLSQALGALIPAITPILDAIGPILGQLGETIAALIQGLAPALAPIAQVIAGLAPIIGQLGAALVPVVQAIALALAGLAPIITPVARILADLFTTGVSALLPVLTALIPPLLEVGRAFGGALLEALKALEPVLPPLGAALAQVAAAVGQDLANALTALAPALPALANLVRIGAELIARIPPPVLTRLIEAFLLFRTVGPALGGATKGIQALTTVGGKLGPALGLAQKAWTALSTSFLANPLFLVIAGVIALGAALVLAYQHFEPFRAVVDAIGRALRDAFLTALEAVTGALRAVVSWIADHWQVAMALLLGPVGVVLALVITHFSTIRSFITGVLGGIASAWSTVWNGMVGVVTSVVGTIGGAVRGLLNGVIGIINTAIRFLNRTLQLHVDIDIPDWLPGPDRLRFDYDGPHLPQIPTLHTGGIFRAPAGATEGLALLADGEAVLKPSQLSELLTARDGAGRGAPLVGNLYAWDARSAATALTEELAFARLAGV